MRILVIEDEKYIALPLAKILKSNNYLVDISENGLDGLDKGLSNIYDIILLDIMLPEIDGFTILQELRKHEIMTPVIMLSARDQIKDKIMGLDYGADDYVAKPFDYGELLMRIKAILRRSDNYIPDNIIIFSNFSFNPHTLIIECDNKEVTLSIKEAQLLEMLLNNKNNTISKDQIIEKLWPYESDVSYSQLDYHTSMLRKKIREVNVDILIKTIRGIGYCLIEENKDE